jgi:hypothetical protein
MFRRFDLSFAIVEWGIIEIDSWEAKIRVVQITRKIAGDEPFRDSKLDSVRVLKKNGGESGRSSHPSMTSGMRNCRSKPAPVCCR